MLSRTFVTAALVLLALLGSALTAQSPSVYPVDTGLTPSRNDQTGVSVTSVPGTSRFVVAWSDEEGISSNNSDVFVAISTDEGLSFGAPVRVDTGDLPYEFISQNVRLTALDNGTIVVIWEDRRPTVIGGSGEQIWYNLSRDAGDTWLPQAIQLTNTTDIDSPQLVSRGNTAWFVGENADGNGGVEGLSFSIFDGASANWSPVTDLHTTFSAGAGFDVDEPFITATDVSLVVAFADDRTGIDEAYALVSYDDGLSFMERSLETMPGDETDSLQCAGDGTLLIIAWEDQLAGNANNDNTINAVVSQDGGLTFGPEFALTDTITNARTTGLASADVLWWDLAVRGDEIYATYAHDLIGVLTTQQQGQVVGDVYFAVSRDRGISFSTDLPFTSLPGPNNRPQLGLGKGEDLFIWFETGFDGRNGGAFAFSRDAGLSFATAESTRFDTAFYDVDAPGGDYRAQHQTVATDPRSGRTLAAFYYNENGGNDVYVACLRPPFLKVLGDPTPGMAIAFEMSHALPSADTLFVAVSEQGATPTPVGPQLGLLHLEVTPLTLLLIDPNNGFMPLFMAPLANGSGRTAMPLNIPAAFSGQTFTFVGTALQGGVIRELTDPAIVTIP